MSAMDCSGTPSPTTTAKSSRVLHEDGGIRTSQQPTQSKAGNRAQGASLGGIGGERKTQPREGIEPNDRQSERRDRANQCRYDGDVMNEIGADGAVNTSCFKNCRKQTDRVHAAAAPINRMQMEAFLPDSVRVTADARRNMHFIASSLCRACHRQAMRNEIPVFRYQIEDFPRHQSEVRAVI